MRRRLAAIILGLGVLVASASALGASPGLKPFERGTWQSVLRGHTGRPTLVHFWGVTCGPCKVELPLLGRFAKTIQRSTSSRSAPISCRTCRPPRNRCSTRRDCRRPRTSSSTTALPSACGSRLTLPGKATSPGPCSSPGKGPSRRSKAPPKLPISKNGRRNNAPNAEVQSAKGIPL